MKVFGLLIFVLFSCLSCKDKRTNVNGNDLWIDCLEWNFGDVSNDDMLFHSYEIYNPTSRSCTITNIIASCECTSFFIKDSIIKSKNETTLDVELNTKGLKGEFIRDIYLFTSLRESPYLLYLSGNIPLSKEEIKRKYRIKLFDNIYSNVSSLYIGNVYQNKIVMSELEIVNTSCKSCSIEFELKDNSNYVSIVAPDSLYPFKPEKIVITYDGNKNKEGIWGVDSTKLILRRLKQKYVIDCNALMVPFPLVKSQERTRMFVQEKNFFSGSEIRIGLKNVGNSDLRIYKIKSSNNIDIIEYDSIILPQEEKYIICKYVGDSCNKDGNIEILSNDDINPVLKLEF